MSTRTKSRARPGWAPLVGLAILAAAPVARAQSVDAVGEVRVVPPADDPAYRPVFSERHLARTLRRHLGAVCDPQVIAEALARPYRFLGYVPEIGVACSGGTLSARVRESSHRIDLIAFAPDELAGIGLTYDPTAEEGPRRLYPLTDDAPRALLRGLLKTREGDLYNFERYRGERQALERLGYTVAFVPGPSRDGDAYPSGAYLVQSLAPRRPGRAAAGRRNYLGGNATYGPRTGVASGVTYRRSDLFGRLDALTLAPSFNAALGGTLGYSAPLLAARTEPRRLYNLDAALFTGVRHDRLLDGRENDERRTGASIVLGVRPLDLRAPHDLDWLVGLRHEGIDLDEPIPGGEDDRLTVLRLGAAHLYRHTYRAPSLTLRFSPAIDLSVASAGGRRSFVRPELDATLHAGFRSGVEIEHHLTAGALDRPVPEFELWSLGGASTVRGFREDSFLGRHLVALQSEIWLPFVRPQQARPVSPGAAAGLPADVPFEPRAARLIKWALFADAGHLWDATAGGDETLLGAGVGLRFVVPRHPLVVRLDYGWGLGSRGGDAFPYVSLGYRF